jgi:hypothetical protein
MTACYCTGECKNTGKCHGAKPYETYQQWLKSYYKNFVDETDIITIPSRRDWETVKLKKYRCGECGMIWDPNVVMGYACGNEYCPIFPRITCK